MADSDENTPSTPSSAGPWKMIALVVAITLMAIWLVPGEEKPETAPIAPPASNPANADKDSPSLLQNTATDKGENPQSNTDTAASAPQTAKQETSAEEPPTEVETKPLLAGEAARKLISELRKATTIDTETAYQQAVDFEAQNKGEDAYLLYFFAAREGHGNAALRMARLADPTQQSDHPLAKPDQAQAIKWYQKSLDAGVEAARAPLTELKTIVETAAAAGDDRAQRILLQWK